MPTKLVKLVFDLSRYIADCQRRGYDKKKIAKQISKWAQACNGMTPREIDIEYGYHCQREWCKYVEIEEEE